MKVKIILDMDEPEDVIHHLRMTKALDMACVLWNIIHKSGKQMEEYFEALEDAGDKEMAKGARDAMAVFEATFYGDLEDHNINIDELIQ